MMSVIIISRLRLRGSRDCLVNMERGASIRRGAVHVPAQRLQVRVLPQSLRLAINIPVVVLVLAEMVR